MCSSDLQHPALRVLIASGYAQSLLEHAHDLPGPLLNKPYRKHDLQRAIDAAIVGGNPRACVEHL